MDSILETIEMSVAAVLFCIAIYLFMQMSENTDSYIKEAYAFSDSLNDEVTDDDFLGIDS